MTISNGLEMLLIASVEAVGDGIASAWNWVATNTVSAWNTISSFLASSWQGIVGAYYSFIGWLQAMPNEVANLAFQAGDWLVLNITTAVSELPGKLWAIGNQTGQAIISGLSQGYQGGLATLKGASAWLFDNTLGRFQQQAKINSPSRVALWMGP